MWWRLQKGESWAHVKGATNKRRFKKLVTGGNAHGALAYRDGVPVGWVAYDRRQDFSRLDRAPSFACEDADRVWSIPCFFIKPEFRGQGVASALLGFAMNAIRRRGGTLVEGYPVKTSPQSPTPAAFAWTGTDRLFTASGFRPTSKKRAGKLRMRKSLVGRKA